MEKIFPDINANFHAPEQQRIFDSRKGNNNTKNSSVDQINAIILQELLHEEATFYPVLTVQVILEIQPDFS